MIDDFFWRALIAGIGVALVAGPLGCFIVWRRMAYFGATLSHSALLGVALGIVLHVNIYIGIFLICLAVSLMLVLLQRQWRLADDTLLGILAHGALALGLVVIAFLETVRIDLMSYLFGDILAVTMTDIAWVYGGGAVCLAVLAIIWRPLLLVTVNEELARVEGVPVLAVRLAYMILIGVVIAVAMKIVGILLIVSMLIIPPAAARQLANTPQSMALLASAIGAVAVVLGLNASLRLDTPSGPSIVVAALLLFLLSLLPLRSWRRKALGEAGSGQ